MKHWIAAMTAMFGLAAPLGAQSDMRPPSPLELRLAALASASGGRVGIAALDLESGQTAAHAGDVPFPMASTVKIAIAATFLAGVEKGRFTLDQLILLDERDRTRSEGIAEFAPHRGVALSAANLIELALTRSDNTAADMLLKTVGGPAAVSQWLTQAGIDGQRMDRTIAELILDDEGRPRQRGRTAAEVLRAADPTEPWLPSTDTSPINPAFDGDARDTSTPVAMVTLLERLQRGTLLDAEHTRFLLEVMGRCRTGPHRIKGLLPEGTPVAHKTGTLNGISDDVGIVTLPNGDHLALAIFERGIQSSATREHNIAEIARVLYDAFALAPVQGAGSGSITGEVSGPSTPSHLATKVAATALPTTLVPERPMSRN